MLFFGFLHAFSNRLGNLAGFSQAAANVALTVADNDNRAETEPASTLDHFGNPVDVNNLVDQLIFICILFVQETVSLCWLKKVIVSKIQVHLRVHPPKPL
jgi:hypothetical protein